MVINLNMTAYFYFDVSDDVSQILITLLQYYASTICQYHSSGSMLIIFIPSNIWFV